MQILWRLGNDTFLKPFPMGFPCKLKVGRELHDDNNYLLKLGGFCQDKLILLYFSGQFLRKIGWFKIFEFCEETSGVKSPISS